MNTRKHDKYEEKQIICNNIDLSIQTSISHVFLVKTNRIHHTVAPIMISLSVNIQRDPIECSTRKAVD